MAFVQVNNVLNERWVAGATNITNTLTNGLVPRPEQHGLHSCRRANRGAGRRETQVLKKGAAGGRLARRAVLTSR